MRKLFSLFAAVLMAVSVMADTAELTQFTATSGSLDENISYASYKGGGTADPAISSKQLRLYQRASKTSDNTIGGYITITAASGYKISSVTWSNGIATTYTYSVDEVLTNGTNDFPFSDLSGTKDGTSTISDLDCSSITLYARGTASGNRLYLASLSVTYASTSTTPRIVASNVNIESDATSGEIAYSITNPVTSVNPTVAITSGAWISNAQVDVANSKITFDAEENTSRDDREATLTISYTGATDKVVTVTQKKMELTEIVDVTGAMTWDFSGYTTDVMPEDKAVEVILGNYVTLTTGDANALKGKQQYIVRNNYCWQGTDLIFHPTVAGVVEVNWSSTSSSNYRTLKVNDGDYAVPGGSNSTSAAGGVITKVFVPANEDVVLTGWNFKNGEYTSNQIRIWSMKFTPAPETLTMNLVATDGDSYYATFSSEYAWVVPANLVVSEVSVVDGELYIEDYATSDVVPANTGVLVAGEAAGEYTVEVETDPETLELAESVLGEDNMLRPASVAKEAEGFLFYKLAYASSNKDNLGFYWGAAAGGAFTSREGSAYLAVPVESEAPARFLFNSTEEVTALENVAAVEGISKKVVNGRLFILRDGKTFDVVGRLVK